MVGLVAGDGLEVGVEWVGESSTSESSLGVVGETVAVESVLEVLKGKSVVEDITVVASLTAHNWASCRETGKGGNADGKS